MRPSPLQGLGIDFFHIFSEPLSIISRIVFVYRLIPSVVLILEIVKTVSLNPFLWNCNSFFVVFVCLFL